MVQVHRFEDAVSIGTAKDTRYLTTHEARRIAAGIVAIADSIEREEFSKSEGLTVSARCYPHLTEMGKQQGELQAVNFRVWPESEGGDVIALLPGSPNPDHFRPYKTCASYQRIGQHGDASPALFDELAQAHPEESAALKHELEGLGYVLREFEYYPPKDKPAPMPACPGTPGSI